MSALRAMFTGLVETVGEVESVTAVGGGLRVRVRTSLAPELAIGDSVAVNGCCLTMVELGVDAVSADVGPETARLTTIGEAVPGRVVNLERSLGAAGRFGGHFVQGHIDGTGHLTSVREEGEAHWLTIAFPPALAPLLVPKGSIAVDGISLTVATLEDTTFSVMIIPHTWAHTNLRTLVPGDAVNLECDMIGKYVARALAVLTPGNPRL